MIARTDFKVYVEGAEKATQQFNAIAQAEKRAGEEGVKAGKGIDAAVTGGASGVKALGRALDSMLGPLRTAANIIPGLGIGGLVLGLIQPLKLLEEGFDFVAGKIGLAADNAKRLAVSGKVLTTELVAQKLQVDNISDAMDRYAKSLGVASAAQLTFAEKQAALGKIASGELKTQEGVESDAAKVLKKLNEAQAFLKSVTPGEGQDVSPGAAAALPGAQRKVAELQKQYDALTKTELGLLGRKGANPWVEAVTEYGKAAVASTRVAAAATVGTLRDIGETTVAAVETDWKLHERAVEQRKRAMDEWKRRNPSVPSEELLSAMRTGRFSSFGQPNQPGQDTAADEADYQQRMQDRASELDDFYRSIESSTKAAKEELDPFVWALLTGEQTNGALGTEILDEDKSLAAFKRLGEGFSGMMSDLVTSATDGAQFVGNALSQLSGAVGAHIANIIVAGDFGAKSFRKDIGNILAGLSAQAFGYAFLLEGLAVAASLTGVLGLAAPGIAAAGGVMAGVGVALGVGARALGADPLVGGSKGHGGGGGGGAGGGAGGYLHNPYSGGQSDTHVTVVIGGEVVTRGITTETRTIERRGGITEPRLARAQ